MTTARGLCVLAVDDERPALDELAYLLRADERVAEVRVADSGPVALRLLDDGAVEAVFLDIRMPGLDGLAMARLLGRFAAPPQVVFVTAYDDAAVDAFALHATDYLLKPLRPDRLGEAIRRVCAGREAVTPAPPGVEEETIPVELAGVTRFVPLPEVRFVAAAGDYARLHTAAGSHLVRVPLATLAERWAGAGFVRVHRSYLVATAHITELRVEPGGTHAVRVGEVVLPVSRRHSRELKERLLPRARRQPADREPS